MLEADAYTVLVQREMESGVFPVSEYKAISRASWTTPPNVVGLASDAATGFKKKSGWLVPPIDAAKRDWLGKESIATRFLRLR